LTHKLPNQSTLRLISHSFVALHSPFGRRTPKTAFSRIARNAITKKHLSGTPPTPKNERRPLQHTSSGFQQRFALARKRYLQSASLTSGTLFT